ncbi:hydroxyacid dehydrogenase [Pseudactinotalea suaedae]|uniref:hydroxyacid dehydrogenase n=1 Tax=Pseudactinotalea suaedae TaxID=1524924 RepID=UPI0012E14927|nr:hydroxyacid dehydrogenase [Pseudactinotalea suaedae]
MSSAPRPLAICTFGEGVADAVLSPADRARLARLLEIEGFYTEDAEALGSPRLDEIEVLVTGWGGLSLPPAVLEQMPSLKLVLYAAGSVRHLVSDQLWARGIRIVSAADANNEPVADYTYAAIILALKGEHQNEARYRRERGYVAAHDELGIYGRTVGLVGFGSIARKVASRLQALEARTLVYDPYLSETDALQHGVERVETLADLFESSRVVSVHAPWIPGVNDAMIGRAELESLPHGAVLLNTARGALVDEEALVAVLRARPDLLANLDVTWPEPPADDSPLWEQPNVKLTGHIAGSIGTERTQLGRLVIDELERWLAGQPLQHEVTEDVARTRA